MGKLFHLKTYFLLGLIVVGSILTSFPVWAQNKDSPPDRNLKGFSYDYPTISEPGFIDNRFGFKQSFITAYPSAGVKTVLLTEQVSGNLRLHEYFGISGKFSGSFNIGGDFDQSSPKFGLGYALRADGIVSIKAWRSDEFGSQWIFHIKTTYQKNRNSVGDTHKLDLNLDEKYFSTFFLKPININELKSHIGFTQFIFSESYTYTGVGPYASWMQTFTPHFAMTVSAGFTLGGADKESIKGLASQIEAQSNIGIAAIASASPWLPVNFRIEYEREVIDNKTNNLGLGSIIYKGSKASVTASAGILFIEKDKTPVGSVGFDYYF